MDFTQFCGIEKLNGNNYDVWAMKVEAYLQSKGIWDDIFEKDEEGSNDPKTTERKTKRNKEALSYLILTVSTEILPSIKGIKDAKKVWAILKERYEGVDEEKMINLVFELSAIKMKTNESVEEYLSRCQCIVREIGQLGKDLSDRELIRYVIEGLPSSFEPMVNPILANRSIKFNEVRQSLLTFEKRVKSSKSDESRAYKTTMNSNTKRRCFLCNKQGHLKADCWYNEKNKHRTRHAQNLNYTKNKFRTTPQNKVAKATEDYAEFALSVRHFNEESTTSDKWLLDLA